ncbi:hypothetical protein JKF63_07792 [Porcisia hertigi]|uniref:Uncharacterized protein n=1 Tax=Porcisia hertigi TaxID=2761500 RepID=A0A836LMH8_9TRYP|nr:hypothetical protein JKF63_07792 [Porcisia hertigi]
MLSRELGVSRLARAVARGDGDWASVPPALRDVIVIALRESSCVPVRSIRGRVSTAPYGDETKRGSGHANAATAPAPLTEEAVQSSIFTFDDAAWVRHEAVRSYAEFHNNIESMHVAMRTQLRPVWRTAMQLHPGILADIRDEYHLSRRGEIPDGIAISAAASQHIALQEAILGEVEDTLQALRNMSVRLAAHFLSDEEKVSMGANPAYLRAPDIDREVVASRSQSTSTSPNRPIAEHVARASASAGSATSGYKKSPAANAFDGVCRISSRGQSRDHNSSIVSHHEPHNGIEVDLVSTASDRRVKDKTSSSEVRGVREDPLLEELRRLYRQRVKELRAQTKQRGEPPKSGRAESLTAVAPPPRHGSLAHIASRRSPSSSSTASSASANSLASSTSAQSCY